MKKISWYDDIIKKENKNRFMSKHYKDKIMTDKDDPHAEGDNATRAVNTIPEKSIPNGASKP